MALGTKNQAIKGCGMHHLAVQANDYEASKKFYTEVLGFENVLEWGDARKICMLDMGDGSHIELFAPGEKSEETMQSPLMMHLALFVEDVDAAIETVRFAGAEANLEPREVQIGSQKAKISFFNGTSEEELACLQYL